MGELLGLRTMAAGAALLSAPAHVQSVSPRFASVDRVIHEAVDAKTVSFASVLVVVDGKVVFRDSAGYAGSGRSFRTDTLLRLQSMTKPLIAVSILTLVDQGKLRLDDPVGKYLPALAGRLKVRVPRGDGPIDDKTQYDLVSADRAITVRDLLTHTSGLQSIRQPNAAVHLPEPGDTLEKWLARTLPFPLDFQPGTRWAYSNVVGFEVLARVVEIASGQPINLFLQRQLLLPLGMRDTGFGISTRADLAGRVLTMPDYSTNERASGTTYFSGAAGLWGTIDDYAKFAQMLADDGVAHGHRFLTPSSYRLFSTNQVGGLFHALNGRSDAPGLGFGLSVAVVQDAANAHVAVPDGSFGWDGVGTTRFWVSPRKHRVVVMHIPSAAVQQNVEQAIMSSLQH